MKITPEKMGEIAVAGALIGASLFPVRPAQANLYTVKDEYPDCGRNIGLIPNHTYWVTDVTEGGIRKLVPVDLGALPGQCENPKGNNDITVDVVLSKANAIGGFVYSKWDIPMSCFEGATGYTIEQDFGSQGHGFNAVSGGINPKFPSLNNLAIKESLVEGVYTNPAILKCRNPYSGKFIPVRRMVSRITYTK